MMRKSLLVILIASLAISCSTSGDPKITYQWPQTDSIKSVVLHSDTSLIGTFNPRIIGDYVLFQDLLQRKSRLYSCYHIVGDSLRWVNGFINVGKGPKESFRASLEYMPDTKQAYIFMSPYHVSVFNTFKVDMSGDINALFNTDNYIRVATPERNSMDGTCPVDSVSFLTLTYDDNNSMVKYYNTHDSIIIDLPLPYPEDGVEVSNTLKSMIYMGRIKKHPSETKFVYSSSYGHYVIMFDMKNGILQNLVTLFNTYPTYTPRKDGSGVKSLPDCPFGLEPALSSKYIYLLKYDFDKVSGSEIMVFDWTGNPVRKLALDAPVSFISVDPSDGVIYAFARAEGDTEEQMLRFEL